ncbi:hypothetical protein FQN55_001688 [Onygenales sp. PD_40]|nr:hypothetical protein FQN55_001688 [Onygenales sp. PD_40]KAK2786392.1 hypothetical protein FQN52_007849 [Onygenales sp. PD_12]KAK2798646.1 hypothetical protein FQN51_007507 [Onygenales sp. PD_10]
MSYQGFGYTPYQQLPSGQSNQSYSSLRGVPSSSSNAAGQQTDRSYGQQGYGWQGQNNVNTQQPQSDNWSANTPSQSYGYQQQQQQSSYNTDSPTPTLNNISYASPLESIAMHNSASTSSHSNTPYQMNAQTQNRSRSPATMPITRPDSAQSQSRKAAASAMTALSSSVPPRVPTQRLSTSSYSHTPNHGTPLSTMVASNTHSSSSQNDYRQQPPKPQYNRTPAASTQSNMARTQKGVRHNYSPPVTSATLYPNRSASSQRPQTADYNNATQDPPVTSSYANTNTSTEATTTQSHQASMPSFIDPSQIYNPYHQEYQKKKAAEAEAEAVERSRKQEKEKEEQQARQQEKEQEEQRAAIQAEIAQKLEAAKAANAARAAQPQDTTVSRSPAVKKKPGPKPKKQGDANGQPAPKKRRPRKSEKAPPPAAEDEPDEDMELARMLQKIRKLKSKDPSKYALLMGDLDDEPSTSVNASQPAAAKTSISTNAEPPIDLTDDSIPAHLDRGKFPAARRKRRSNAKDLANPTASVNPTASPQPARESTPAQPVTAPEPAVPKQSESFKIEKLIDTPEPQPEPQPEAQPQKAESIAATIWPDSKRLILAQAACGYIESITRNEGKKCDAAMVLGLINQNPSYIQLCGMLEAQGFYLNRVHFAKHLLKAVPELTNSPAPAPAPAPAPQQKPAPSPIPAPAPAAPTPGPQDRVPSTASPGTAALPAPSSYQSPYNNIQRQVSHPPMSSAPPPGPDLTFINSTPSTMPATQFYPPAGSVPPENQVPGFLGSPPKKGPIRPPVPPPVPPPVRPPTKPSTERLGPQARARPPKGRHSTGRQSTGRLPVGLGPAGGKLNPKLRVPATPAHVPAPGSKEAMARKRNFSEIVDLSLALSDEEDDIPPAKEPRLEEPQEAMHIQDTQMEDAPHSQVNDTHAPQAPPSGAKTLDLSKFKMAGADSAVDNESLRRDPKVVKPLNKAEALRTRYYDPKTIARDILIATGRHPTERPLNQHLSKLKDNFAAVEYSSDLHTFRWDVVDPGGPPAPEAPLVPVVSRPPMVTIRERRPPAPARLSNRHPRDLPTGASEARSQFPRSHLHISQTANSDALSSSPIPQNTTLMESATPRGRRGRPPGAKNKTHAWDRVQVAIPTRSPASGSRPSYRVYSCQWKNCDAQLHNLGTLRKHVTRLHVTKDRVDVSCRWAGCNDGPEGTADGKAFTSEELCDHLEKQHLGALAWTLGEGPSSVRPGLRDDHYMNDLDGRTVISKATTEGSQPTLILPAAYGSIRNFNKNQDNHSDRAKAMEVLRALEAKQMRVGTGLDRGGCTFMNERRQETVAAFESVFELIPDDRDGP